MVLITPGNPIVGMQGPMTVHEPYSDQIWNGDFGLVDFIVKYILSKECTRAGQPFIKRMRKSAFEVLR